MNKRDFMMAAGGAMAGAPVWSTALPAQARSAPGDASLGTWQAVVGETFDVLGAAGGARLQLLRVDRPAADTRVEQFTLVFRLAGAPLAPGSRVLRRDDGRLLALYLDDGGTEPCGAALLRADCARLV